MSKKTSEPCEGLDLFSIAGVPKQAHSRDEKLKSPPQNVKHSRKKFKQVTSPASADEVPSERFLQDSEVAHRYGVGRQTVWRWAAQGALPEPIKLSVGVTRWRPSDLITHENSLPKGAKGKVVRASRLKTAKAAGQQ